MTEFSFEVPLRHLKDFDEDQDFYFTLSFLFQHTEYASYIAQVRLSEREVWIDNSTNELRQPESCSSLAELYRSLSPAYVIAPDHPDWNQETMLLKALELSHCNVPLQKVMVIIHHPDWIGHFSSYGLRNFAIPYDFRYCTESKLKRFGECHFLGLVSVSELKCANPPTCDTSMPIKLACVDKTLEQWVSAGCPHVHTEPNFFNKALTLREVKLAKDNIRALKEVVSVQTTTKDVVNHPAHYTQGKIEVLDFIMDQKLPYLPSTVLKYICRYRYKNGLEDLKKAEFYLKTLIKEYEDEGACS